MHNKKPLTQLQKIIIGRIIDGWQNKEIAQQLNYSESAISYNLKKIYKGFGVKNRTELILKIFTVYAKNRY